MTILSALARRQRNGIPQSSVKEIAAAIGKPKSTVDYIMRGLSDHGLLVRSINPENKTGLLFSLPKA